ncbi:ABC transporter ATP-binding protein [Roseimaritima sediminicola]|uniref:ABC transporter ATP-binding protein n=1 Tax=Roseimaritima sediminicola TaxID=2662066 RepID=UPI0012984FB2|nr:ABC transporter ATP-binding protein [Roseimaritima sediminicola]
MNRSTETPAAAVQNAAKQYKQGHRRVEALQGVDLEIEAGRFVAVMGASGSGKSTLLHLLGGLTRPSSGTISIGGQNLAELSDRRLTQFRRDRIGLVFQDFNLIPSLTAYDNVLFPLYAAGINSPDSSRVQDMAVRLGIHDRLEHRPDSLSGGEQQRVAIARALVADPAIVLADEPTGSLDSVSSEAICKLLRELCDRHDRTLVVVTHEPSVAVWADEIVVLKDGRLVERFLTADYADAQSLATHYQSLISRGEPAVV